MYYLLFRRYRVQLGRIRELRAYFYDATRGTVWSNYRGINSRARNVTVDGGARMMRCALSSTSMYVVKLIVYGTVANTSACLHSLFTKPFFFSCRVLRAGLVLPSTNEKGQVYHPLQPRASLQVPLTTVSRQHSATHKRSISAGN